MAARQFGVWGIDLGQCALKAIRLEVKDDQVVATAFEYIEHAKILSQPDADPDELINEALTQFLSRNAIRGDVIAISVPGQSGLARFVKLPPVNQNKVADIVKFEAKQQIPFPLEEVVWDFQQLSTGEVVDGMALETEIGLFAMKRDMVNRAIQQFKDVNVEVHLVQMAPLALCNFVSYDLLAKDTANTADEEDHSCIVALEIGTDSSNLVITDGGKIIWQRPIPIGGNHFTRALTKELKLTFAKAEHLKRNAAKSPELKKILSALKQVLNDFVGEVQRSLGYFTNTHRNAQIQYMIGLGNAFRLPGLQKFLQEKLQLEVRKLHELQRSSGDSVTSAPTFAENIMSFAVAYGLALQGLKQARLQTNLLPHEVRMERLVRGKKPWLVTAAASLLFGLFMLAFARGMEKSAVVNPELRASISQLDKIVKEQQTNKDLAKMEEKKVTDAIEALTRIGAGVQERLNWQLLHQYVNFAMPQPNGDRLALRSDGGENVKATYWDGNPKAKKAYEMMQEKKFQNANQKKEIVDPIKAVKDDQFIKENLIQINIVGINALYSEDLGPYYRKIFTDGNKLLGMHQSEKKQIIEFASEADPEKAKTLPFYKDIKEGWIIELRGYTFHDKKDRFVEDTLIENLKFPNDAKFSTPEMKSRVQDRVGFLNIYKLEAVKNPIAGEFKLISKSYLKTLLKGADGANKGVAVGQPVPQPGPGGDPNVKLSRDAWKPLGEMARSIFGDIDIGRGPAFAPPVNPKDAAAPTTPRTEFVVLFLWREPITPAVTASADKKN